MHYVFDSELRMCIIIYLDHILNFSRNEEEHPKQLILVYQKIPDHYLKAKIVKYCFKIDTVDYLGHIIKNSIITADSVKVSTVMHWP